MSFIKLYSIWHNKLFDECYNELDDETLQSIVMYGVNDKYEKIYNTEKGYNIQFESNLPFYNRQLQDNYYCQTSCMYHVYMNKLYTNTSYIGFIQYDMVLHKNIIQDIQDKIQTNKEIYFYSLLCNKLHKQHLCLPYKHSILEKYNQFFNTEHTYQSIVNSNKSEHYIILHTFVIPTSTFVKMMGWYCSMHDWLHENNVKHMYCSSPAEVTEDIFGLFLLLQMIEDDNIRLEPLQLTHEWPRLLNSNTHNGYKQKI
jgi:hypothetical protein